MRISPTQEQIAYLISVGVSKATITQTDPAMTARADDDNHATPRPPRKRSLRWWAVVIAILVLVLLLAGLSRGQSQRTRADKPVPPADPYYADLARRLATLEKELVDIQKSIRQAATRQQWTELREWLKPLESALASWYDTLLAQGAQDRAQLSHQLEGVRADIRHIGGDVEDVRQREQDIEGLLVFLMSPEAESRAPTAPAEHTDEELVRVEVEELRESLAQQRRYFDRVIIQAVAISILITDLLLAATWILMQRRVREAEQIALSGLSERSATVGVAARVEAPAARADVAGKASSAGPSSVKPTRLLPTPPPSPTEQMRAIIDAAGRSCRLRAQPRLSREPWRLGLATSKGGVRSENQDYGLCFQTDGHDVLIVADGCGGIPRGQRAAYLAAVSAAVSIVHTYGRAPCWRCPPVREAAEKALLDASHRLAVEGDRLNVTDIRGGLRTTLIVVIGNKHETGFAFIGDGGGYLVRSSGKADRFLQPQKAENSALNVLAASLGPTMEGKPVTGVLPRAPGDLLVVGTDGVFDRVDEGFLQDVLRGCLQYGGDLQKTADRIVEELASFQDDAGFICDDNLTLGIMGSGAAPRLAPGFWSSLQKAEPHAPAVLTTETTSR